MPLVRCPECGKPVSEFAKSCPDCGFPIREFMEEHNLTDANYIFICPDCGSFVMSYDLPNDLKCRSCGAITKQIDITCKEYIKTSLEEIRNGNSKFNKQFVEKYCKDTLKPDSVKLDKERTKRCVEEANARLQQEELQQKVPHCPKCGSTSISTGARGVNHFWGFIGASQTVNRCANCGHTWKPNGK
jgi:hypothetical protein